MAKVTSVGNGVQKINDASWVKTHRHAAQDIANKNAEIAVNLQRENDQLRSQIAQLQQQLNALQQQVQTMTAPPQPGLAQNAQGLPADGLANAFGDQFLQSPTAGMQPTIVGSFATLSGFATGPELERIAASLSGRPAFSSFPWCQDNFRDIIAFNHARCLMGRGHPMDMTPCCGPMREPEPMMPPDMMRPMSLTVGSYFGTGSYATSPPFPLPYPPLPIT